MATFQALEDRARSEIVAEVYEDQYVSASMQGDFWNSSVELGALFGIPKALKEDTAVTAGDLTVAAPTDMVRLTNLIINGDQGVWADIPTVLQERSVGAGPLRVFHHDPRMQGDILIGPATNYTGTVEIEYTQRLSYPSDLAAAEPWTPDGGTALLREWHWLVIYHAAARLFQEAEREDEVPYWMQLYQSGITNFAIFLGREDVADLILGGIKAGPAAQAGTPQQPQGTRQAQQSLGYGGSLGQ